MTQTEYADVMSSVRDFQWGEWEEGETPGPCGNGLTYNQMAAMDPDDEEYQMTPFSELWNAFAQCTARGDDVAGED